MPCACCACRQVGVCTCGWCAAAGRRRRHVAVQHDTVIQPALPCVCAGDAVELCDGRGGLVGAEVAATSKSSAVVRAGCVGMTA